MFRPVRLRPGALAGILVVALVAIGSNIAVLRDGYRFLHQASVVAKAQLGALDIARGLVAAEFELGEATTAGTRYLDGVTAAGYYRERDEHGSPAYSMPEIDAAPGDVRQAVDTVLLSAYAVRLTPDRSATPPAAGCDRVGGDPAGRPTGVELPPGGARITNRGAVPAAVAVRRFAPPGLEADLGALAGGFTARVRIPEDPARRPWHLHVGRGSRLEVCPW
jgi:hypothetical protein